MAAKGFFCVQESAEPAFNAVLSSCLILNTHPGQESFDWAGTLIYMAALFAMIFGATHIGKGAVLYGGLFVAGIVGMVCFGEVVPEADPDDARELLNYRSAFEFVSECLDSGDPITEGLIREIHRKLVEGVRGGKAAPGNYRRIQNYVANSSTGEVIYTPPSGVEVPIMMSEMVKWLNSDLEIHPVLVSGIAQFQLVHIHPFPDGNGRTSRLLSTLCLYKAGYDFKRLFTISEYYDLDRPAFYKSIQSVRENGMDMTGWLDYFITGLETQMIELKERGEQVIRRDVLVHKHGLNERQGKALEFLLQHGKLAIHDFEMLCPDVNRRSLQRDLKGFLEKGLVKEVGAGPTDPTRHYMLSEL